MRQISFIAALTVGFSPIMFSKSSSGFLLFFCFNYNYIQLLASVNILKYPLTAGVVFTNTHLDQIKLENKGVFSSEPADHIAKYGSLELQRLII